MKWRRSRQLFLAVVIGLLAQAATSPARAGDTGVRDASGGDTRSQTEQTLAVDPTNPDNVLVGSFGGGVSVSHDGGVTWKRAPIACGQDNNPAFDRSGVAYFECNYNGVELYRSTDKGDTWTGPLAAVTYVENNGDLVDRPWLVRGRGARDVVIGWESFFTNPVAWVYLKVSNDGGTTWGPRRRVDDPDDHPALPNPRQLPVVGADGTIYVVYASGHGPYLDCRNCFGLLPTDYVVARSSDGGVTFRRSVAAANIARSDAPTEESEAIASLSADPNPARAKHLAVAWADERSGESRILVATSVDGGVTWSQPVDAPDDPPGTGVEHDHPQVGFAPDGRLVVVWRDRRCCGGGWNSSYELFARAFAMTGTGPVARGATVTVTDVPQRPNSNSSFDEYMGLTVGPEGMSVAWNQLRAGVPGSTYRRLAPPSPSR